jgi:hypothetical protein
MAKFKPKGNKKVRAKGSNRGLIPCSFLILLGFTLLFLLFYEILKSGK